MKNQNKEESLFIKDIKFIYRKTPIFIKTTTASVSAVLFFLLCVYIISPLIIELITILGNITTIYYRAGGNNKNLLQTAIAAAVQFFLSSAISVSVASWIFKDCHRRTVSIVLALFAFIFTSSFVFLAYKTDGLLCAFILFSCSSPAYLTPIYFND